MSCQPPLKIESINACNLPSYSWNLAIFARIWLLLPESWLFLLKIRLILYEICLLSTSNVVIFGLKCTGKRQNDPLCEVVHWNVDSVMTKSLLVQGWSVPRIDVQTWSLFVIQTELHMDHQGVDQFLTTLAMTSCPPYRWLPPWSRKGEILKTYYLIVVCFHPKFDCFC